jgi:hypothetical protein
LGDFADVSEEFLVEISETLMFVEAFQKFMGKWHPFGKRKFGKENFFLTKIVSLELKLT